MNTSVHFSSKSNEWQTPKNIFDSLNKEFDLRLDAAATKENALCDKFYTQEDDALIQDWNGFGNVWCNPPYGRMIGKFVKKAYEESLKGATVVMLIPARVDTTWWYKFCAKTEVRFIKGRLKFINKAFPSYKEDMSMKISPAPFPSAIVIFKPDMIPVTKYIEQKMFE